MLENPKANKTTTRFLSPRNERDGDESRKNLLDENEVKSPVLFLMDNQQPRPKGKVQRLFLGCRNTTTEVRLKRVGENPLNGNDAYPGRDKDIVYSHVKI